MKRKPGPLVKLRMLVAARMLFARERVSTRVRVQAVLAYFGGMSFRRVAAFFEHAFCAESVRYWWNRMSVLLDYPRGSHGIVVADETGILLGPKNLGRAYILWVAIDARDMYVINTKFARYQYNLDCRDFLSEIKHKSRPKNPLILHDRAAWYTYQASLAGVRHKQVRGARRSLIECWNRQLKHRLDGFWRAFPRKTRPDQMHRWLRSYAAIWNATR